MAIFVAGSERDDATEPDGVVDLTAHVLDGDDTPVTTHACNRCGRVCVEVQRWDMLGGLPDYCAHSADWRWRYCIGTGPGQPCRIVYYPEGPPKP